LLVVAFCLLLLWHDPLLFWNDDYELSILPVFADVARSWSQGHLPLLSPYSWVCSNLAGEFQYGTFSIFVNAAVVLIWKFPLGFAQQAAALSMTHLFVLAAGAFLLARDRKLSFPLSIFVSLVAALNGWIICWGASDWFGALGAFAWLPWAWWGLERALDPERGRWRFVWPASFVYLVVAGGFPYTVVMLALLVAWLAIKSVADTRSVRAILPMLFGAALGFGLGAPAWLALLDYVHGSARELQPSSAHWQWLVPVSALPGFILPCWTVNWADFSTRYLPHPAVEMACGLVPPVALLGGFLGRGRELVRRIRWELGLLALVLAFSMLPTAGLFRWSFRWLPFIHLVLALCAAEALRPRSATAATTGCALFKPGVVGFALVAITAGAMWLLHLGGPYALLLTLIFLGLATFWAISEFVLRDSNLNTWVQVVITFGALLATYLCIPPNYGIPKYNLSPELTKPVPLDPARLYLSVYPPPEFNYRVEFRKGPVGQVLRPGSSSMWAALRFINGYSPILAAGVAREFKFAIHGEIDQDIGRYLIERESGRAGLLEQLGVDGIVVAPEIGAEPVASDWEPVFANGEGRVFHRRGAPFAPVRAVAWIDSRPNEEFLPAAISRIQEGRNSVQCDVDVPDGSQPALLTFSRPYFRGYEARLGGKKLKVDSYRGLFPTVDIPAGSQGRVVLAYCPWWLIYGGGLAILSALVWMVGIGLSARQRPRQAG
jgi:hypothetical protein